MAWPSVLRFSLLLSVLFGPTSGDSSLNEFIYPGPSGPSNNFRADLKMTIGTIETIQWTTNLSAEYDVELFQQAINAESGESLATVCSGYSTVNGTTSCTWAVQTYASNLTFSPIYFFWVNPGSGSGLDSFTSHYFNITDPSTVTSSLPSGTTATTSTTTSSVIPTSTTQTPVTSTAISIVAATTSAAGKNDSTLTQSVGLGAGLGLGVPLVLLAGVLLGLRVVKHRRQHWHNWEHQPRDAMSAFQHLQHPRHAPLSADNMRHHGRIEVYEAPTHEPRWGSQGLYEAGSKTPRPYEM